MPEFWVASGHHLTRLDAAGRMLVTDELLLAWLARPEVMPPADACAAERAIHARLMADPRAPVPALQLAAMHDADARENWAFLLRLREILLEEGSIEAGYARIVHEGVRLPVVFMNQLVQLILRNALDGCQDAQVVRAAELMFRPQRGQVKDGVLMLADPNGAPMGMPVSDLERTPFDSYVIPGLVLLLLWGCGSLVTAFGLWRRPQWPLLIRLTAWSGQHWAWAASIALGLALLVWLTVQVFTLPAVAVIQYILYALAALLIALPLLPSMRRRYRLPAADRV